MRNLKVVALAALVAMSALPATAARFVFDVTVTGVEPGGDFGFPNLFRVENETFPATFQLTFTASGPFATGSYGTGHGNGGSVDAVSTPTPLTAEVMATAGLSGPPDYTSIGLNRNNRGFDYLTLSSSAQVFDVDGRELVGQHDYSMGISAKAPSQPDSDLIPYNYHTLDLFLRQVGAFSFYEYGENQVYVRPAIIDHILYASYLGTATYRADLSAVPEPAQWGLMVAGFGLAGAALRRRRSLAIAV